MVSGQASKSYRFAGAPISDQAKVWGEVSRKLEAMDPPSSSDAMQDLYRTYAVKVVELEQKCSSPADCNAAAFVIAGRIIGNHFFDKSNKLRKLWQKLIRSCSIDALELATEGAESIAPQEISKWLESSASATQEPFP
jgi:hypothetical protein